MLPAADWAPAAAQCTVLLARGEQRRRQIVAEFDSMVVKVGLDSRHVELGNNTVGPT